MNKRHIPGFFDALARTPSFVFLCSMFLCGAAAGGLTGLHAADVHKLIEVLQQLVEAGNTVLVIEHNLDVIKTADYLIDLGPEGGDGGGTLVAAGTPEKVAATEGSFTGAYAACKPVVGSSRI